MLAEVQTRLTSKGVVSKLRNDEIVFLLHALMRNGKAIILLLDRSK